MHRSHPIFRLTACATLIALGGCVSAGDPALSLAPADGTGLELALPDAVAALPELVDRGVDAVAAAPSAMVSALSAPLIQPAAFAPFGRPVGVRSAELDVLIARYASHYDVPEELVRRVVKRESNFDPAARNGPYWGLMQIRHDTARGMGYRGTANGLLDAETNLNYAVRYLRGAYLVAGGNHDLAVRYYSRGYYYDAKRRGLLDETGLGRDRTRKRPSA